MGGIVKICGLMTESQVEAAFAAGADLGGVILGPGRRHVPFEAAQAWARRWPGRLVAVLWGASDEVWARLFEAPWAGLQVYDGPMPDWADRARARNLLTIRPGQREEDRGAADVLLLEGPRPGSGERLPWHALPRPLGRFWLAGGLDPDNVGEAVAALKPAGVDVSSGVERKGEKDAGMMREFVRRAREAMACHG